MNPTDISQLYDAVFNEKDDQKREESAHRLFSNSWVATPEVACGNGPQGLSDTLKLLRSKVPDINWEVNSITQSGKTFIVQTTISGTPVDSFLSTSPTGQTFSISGVDIHSIENDQVRITERVEDWMRAQVQLNAA